MLVFAQAADNRGAGAGWLSMLWLPLVIFLFYFLLIRPQRQEQARREAMVRALKPNDHVLTHAGIYGVVTNVHPEAGIATIRVDENNNTKLKISLGAIARVLTEETARDASSKKD